MSQHLKTTASRVLKGGGEAPSKSSSMTTTKATAEGRKTGDAAMYPSKGPTGGVRMTAKQSQYFGKRK